MERDRLGRLGLAALDRFQDTWNTRDVAVWSSSLHFPHVRPSAAEFDVFSTADDYIRARQDVFKNVLALGWHRSQWDSRQVLHVSEDKMHIAGQYSRRREAGERISTQQVTYIVTRHDGRWGIQSRFGTGTVEAGDNALADAGSARDAVRRYFRALNSLDPEALADTIHLPHVRLSQSGLEYWRDREAFLAGTEPGRQRTWSRIELERSEPIQSGANGTNLLIRYNRLNAEGETLSTYDAVFLVTQRDSKWAVQARSTFAP